MKSRFIILLIIVTFNVCAISTNEEAGTTGFAFLKTGFGARSAAMGQAYTGLSDDINAIFYNPAGLLQMKHPQLAATYVNYFEGINCGNIAYTKRINFKSQVAFFGQFLSATEDRTLVDQSGNYAGTDGTFGMSNILVGFSYAYHLMSVIDLGVNLKYLRENLDDNVGSAVALDIALMHQTTNPKLKIGAIIKNLGKQLEYYSDNKYEENLPSSIAVGFKLQAKDQLIVTGDLIKPFKNDISICLGSEYDIHNSLFLRAGYRLNASDWKTGGDWDATAGISMGLGFNWKKYCLDYAILSYGDLGFVNQISLKYDF